LERYRGKIVGTEAEPLADNQEVTGLCSVLMNWTAELKFLRHEECRREPTRRRVGNQTGEDQALTE
jgi:hypothetical protein